MLVTLRPLSALHDKAAAPNRFDAIYEARSSGTAVVLLGGPEMREVGQRYPRRAQRVAYIGARSDLGRVAWVAAIRIEASATTTNVTIARMADPIWRLLIPSIALHGLEMKRIRTVGFPRC